MYISSHPSCYVGYIWRVHFSVCAAMVVLRWREFTIRQKTLESLLFQPLLLLEGENAPTTHIYPTTFLSSAFSLLLFLQGKCLVRARPTWWPAVILFSLPWMSLSERLRKSSTCVLTCFCIVLPSWQYSEERKRHCNSTLKRQNKLCWLLAAPPRLAKSCLPVSLCLFPCLYAPPHSKSSVIVVVVVVYVVAAWYEPRYAHRDCCSFFGGVKHIYIIC